MTSEKVAIVTAAGKGIGAAIARRLKQSAYQLVLMSPSENCIALTDELDATVKFLLSDGAGHITGQNIRVDGGITRHI